MPTIANLGQSQIDALQFYFLESVHVEWDGNPPFRLDGKALVFDDKEAAFNALIDGCNDADADKFCDWRDALGRLASRVIRS